ncbi:hypothetical protein H0K60_004486 [Salmonella enterica]|nr:hypothetical protein [Salmonella enterica]EFR2649729.1 hypothetical protein [Salmonella enterica]EFS1408078.1 hypothetical protein [Salmonella enterica]EHQ8162526.1 hypothetical protein [Salmonella enterica]EJZ9218179.1 hypothetical protein [Salmonella enterica]
MNYHRIYDELIARAQLRPKSPKSIHSRLTGYANHHIKPAAWFVGGRKNPKANARDNLVFLTHREHFIAHHLLVRIHPEDRSLTLAYVLMCRTGNEQRVTGKLFEKCLLASYDYIHNNPEIIANKRAAALRLQGNAEFSKKMSLVAKKRWSDPEYREATIARIIADANSPERLQAMYERWERLRNDPDFVARHRESIKKRSANPEWRINQKDGAARRSADPEWQKRHRERQAQLEADGTMAKARAKAAISRLRPVIGTPINGGDEIYIENLNQSSWNSAHVSGCCHGTRKSSGGYYWRFASETKEVMMERVASFDRPRRHSKTLVGTCLRSNEVIYLRGRKAMTDAGFNVSGLHRCAKGEAATHNGYSWRYADADEQIPDDIASQTIRKIGNYEEVIGISVKSGDRIHIRQLGEYEVLGLKMKSVAKCLRGERKTYNGYTWRYATAEEITVLTD